jgi:hypothetical protein
MITLGLTLGAINASIPPAVVGTMLSLRDPGSWTLSEIAAGLGAFTVATLGVLIVALLKGEYQRPVGITITRHPDSHLKDAA